MIDLNDFGYAPGNYTIKCMDCGDKPWFCDKYSIRCEECAKKLAAIAAPGKSMTNMAYCWYDLYKLLQVADTEQTKSKRSRYEYSFNTDLI